MRTPLFIATLLVACTPPEPVDTVLFEDAVFYDGYAAAVDEPTPSGVTRLSNDRVATRLDDTVRDALLDTLTMEVTLGARCDNYDRLGGLALAFVPPGAASYATGDVERIELGRFITPFMDQNRLPDEVDYRFDLTGLLTVFTDDERDLWVELEVFGVPYAAQTEVAGCAGRIDVFDGRVRLLSAPGDASPALDTLVPVAYRAPFNNHQEGASDALGTTRKTLTYTLPGDADEVELTLIVSNHGANAGGEEYERRVHNVSVDGVRVHSFTPGRESCEPFRELNTQPNGIYGATPRTDDEWQSFSNWCPGDVIDTRRIPLGPQQAGEHTVVVGVPQARFLGGEGNFPLSVHVQAR